MFTGLVQEMGTVRAIEREPAGARLEVETSLAGELSEGDSIAVNGVCLTAVEVKDGAFRADVMNETLRRSSLGPLEPGQNVNLELPLRPEDRLGGHFVQGHVDAIGRIEEIRAESDFSWLTISFPRHLAPYIIPKGSIAVDGISLTVTRVGADRFDVMIIPFTLAHTNLGRAQVSDPVNLECDMVGKYVVRAAELAGLSLAQPERVTQ